MKDKILLAIIVCAAMSLFSCSSSIYFYKVDMTKVEKSGNIYTPQTIKEVFTTKGGGYPAKEVKTELTGYRYIDENVRVAMFFEGDNIRFNIENLSGHTIKIPWDEVAYTDMHGVVDMVMHLGIKYSKREESQKPSIVPKGGTLKDQIVPIKNVYWDTYSKEYRSRDLMPVTGNLGKRTISSLVNAAKGKNVKILMPIYINDVKCEYTFIFEITGVLTRVKKLGQAGIVTYKEVDIK